VVVVVVVVLGPFLIVRFFCCMSFDSAIFPAGARVNAVVVVVLVVVGVVVFVVVGM